MLKQMTEHQKLVQSILQGKLLPEQEHQSFKLIETHISSVIVGDDIVYKLKKPVDFGFLDFSTLQKRHFYCDEEIRLNRRLSPQLYIDVLPVYGSVDNPVLTAQGKAIEYMVRMKPFAQSAQLDRLMQQGNLSLDIIKRFADYIAAFHQSAARVDLSTPFGNPETIKLPVDENFTQIRSFIKSNRVIHQLQQLEVWSEAEFFRIQSLLQQRKSEGFIRECHGDLHLRNLAWMDDQPMAFDCIEFDPKLYWIDVISDLSFLWMDLRLNQREDLAWLLLNQYLSRNGDYSSLAVLRYYSVYRALVRAKIAAINVSQSGSEDSIDDLEKHMDLALKLSRSSTPVMYLMHGPSASGKSTLSQQLSAPLQAVILRSDVERKRLFGLSAEYNAASDPDKGIYSSEATSQTYQHLLELSRQVLEAGYSVIVDATFSHPHQRTLFIDDAVTGGYRCVILDLKVSKSKLRQRIQQRKQAVSDADIRVLENQLQNWLPLTPQEQQLAVTIDLEEDINLKNILQSIAL
jgi:uncharacterized protein